jgi:hypothetical protein
MSIRRSCLAVGIFLFACTSVSAQVRDAVELLPPQTLACIELRNPEGLSREVAALVKGSALDDLPRRLSKMGGLRSGDFRFQQHRELLTFSSIFLCPEAINEAGRIRGGFIALTGFAKDNTPEWVGVLQTGSSNFPAIIMRAFVTETSPKMVGEVEGVSLYREKRYVYAPIPAAPGGQPGMPRQPEERESGPVIGQMPGLILFGSSVDSLKAVIQRAKSKRGGASLTNLQAFKESAALRGRPGLFAYVDLSALEAKLDEPTASAEGRPTTLKMLLGNQTLRSLTFSLTLQSGTLEGRMRVQLDGKNDSPLFGLLPDRAAQVDLLHFAPNDALLALTGGLGDNEKRWKTVLNLLDATYKLRGSVGDNRPSRAIEELEKKLEFRINKDVLAEVTAAGVVVGKDWRHKPEQATLLLRATDEKTAAKLEKEGLPRLFSLGESEVRVPTEGEVQGRRIKTLKAWSGAPVHYGRQGAILVLGLDKEGVAESLIAGGKKAGLLAETKVSSAIKEIDDKTAAVGVLSSARAAMDLFAVLSRPSIQSRPMMKMPAPPGGGAPGAAPPPPPPPRVKVEDSPDKTIELSKPMQALFKESEPLVFCLNRQAESLVLEIRPMPLRRMTPRLLEAWVEALLKPSTEAPPVPGRDMPVLPPAKIKR